MDWDIVLLDEVPDEDGAKWEQYYYDELMPLYNVRRPGQTKLEYDRATGYASQKAYYKEYRRSDKRKEYVRTYYQANRERIKQYQRNWYANR